MSVALLVSRPATLPGLSFPITCHAQPPASAAQCLNALKTELTRQLKKGAPTNLGVRHGELTGLLHSNPKVKAALEAFVAEVPGSEMGRTSANRSRSDQAPPPPAEPSKASQSAGQHVKVSIPSALRGLLANVLHHNPELKASVTKLVEQWVYEKLKGWVTNALKAAAGDSEYANQLVFTCKEAVKPYFKAIAKQTADRLIGYCSSSGQHGNLRARVHPATSGPQFAKFV